MGNNNMLNVKKLIVSFFNKKRNKNINIEVSTDNTINKLVETNYIPHHYDKIYEYDKKDSYLSNCERKFYQKLLPLINEGYNVEKQVSLSAVVKKCYKETGYETKYRNELFRIIDFGIFDKDNNILVLIELNDATHNRYERIIRDQRVNEICKKANIKLLTFYTSMPNKDEYVLNRINNAIKEVLGLKDEPFIKVINIENVINEEVLNKINNQRRLQRIKN